jgi:hypothetical protein
MAQETNYKITKKIIIGLWLRFQSIIALIYEIDSSSLNPNLVSIFLTRVTR